MNGGKTPFGQKLNKCMIVTQSISWLKQC